MNAPLIAPFVAASTAAAEIEAAELATWSRAFNAELNAEAAEARATGAAIETFLLAIEAVRPLVEADYVLASCVNDSASGKADTVRCCATARAGETFLFADGSGVQLVAGTWTVILPALAVAA